MQAIKLRHALHFSHWLSEVMVAVPAAGCGIRLTGPANGCLKTKACS